VEVLQPHGNLLVKSGTDFKDLSRIDVTLPAAVIRAANGAATAAAADAAAGSSSSSMQRPTYETEHIQITSDMLEDPEIAEVGALRGACHSHWDAAGTKHALLC
jgi:hypothetical protein